MKEHTYYTYIVASRSLNLYIGFTNDIVFRVRQHKEGAYEGYSKQYNCSRLVWFERYGDVHLAIAREKQLKGWSRAKKIALIRQDNPTWLDLSEDWGKPLKFPITCHPERSAKRVVEGPAFLFVTPTQSP